LRGDDEEGEAHLLGASEQLEVDWNVGATLDMARWSSALFMAHKLSEKNKKRGEEWWRRRGKRLGFAWARSGEGGIGGVVVEKVEARLLRACFS
jgi:hypothetical protein